MMHEHYPIEQPGPRSHCEPSEGALRWLASVFESMPEGVVVVDERGDCVFINPMAEQLLGTASLEGPPARWPERYGLYLPDGVTPFPAESLPLARAIRGEAVGRTEIFMRHAARPAGIWLHAKARPLWGGAGEVRGAICVFSDVAELKEAEAALRRSQETYRSLYRSTPVMMHSIDRDGRLLSVSDFWLEKLGYERAEVLGRRSVDFLTPESRRYAKEVVLPEFFKTGECKDIPYQVMRKNGEPIDVLLSAIAERDATGSIVRSLAVLIDVTERKRMELAQHFLAEASRELVTSLDYEGTLQHVAELAVPALADLCVFLAQEEDAPLRPVAVADVSPDRARAVREFLLLHPPAPDAPHGLLGPEVLEEQRWDTLRSLRGKPSVSVPLQVRGRLLGVLSLHRAQPHRRYAPEDVALAEELGRRAAFAVDNAQLYRKAQESIRARDEFLTIASHELKTPLTSMKLRVQQMAYALTQRSGGPPPAGKVSDILRVFEEQMQRLTYLVNHLLDVSCVNEGRLTLRLEELDLAAVAHGVANHLKAQLERAGCALELEAAEPVVGQWDRLRLEQVVMNLLTNSMKYGAGRPIRMSVGLHDGKARLLVQDHGIGIPHEAQARIFERFERAASHNFGGLGLGLFITRQLVEAHRGSIRVESEPGMGATFTVELPRRPPDAVHS